jgi:hypothetical protein
MISPALMSNQAPKPIWFSYRLAFSPFFWWLLMFPLCIVLWYYPVITFVVRLAAWGAAGLVLAGSVYYSRRWKWAPVVLGLFYGALALFVWLAPASPSVDRGALRNAYCSALTQYEGRPYVWGGESYSCMDCSGLVRKALEDALTTRGLATGNAGLIRSALWLYWHDVNAKEIRTGYAGHTKVVCDHVDYSLMKPGDLGMVDGGVHVMVYLGNNVWIEADPTRNKVLEDTVPDAMAAQMTIIRWTILED